MRRGVLLCALVAALAAWTAAPAAAADPVVIGLPGCIFGSGERTVPAGSQVTVRTSWLTGSYGAVRQFVENVETTATVNGSPVADANQYFGDIYRTEAPPDFWKPDVWRVDWLYDIGTLAVGDSVTVFIDWTLTEPTLVHDEPRPTFIEGPIISGTCTITGA